MGFYELAAKDPGLDPACSRWGMEKEFGCLVVWFGSPPLGKWADHSIAAADVSFRFMGWLLVHTRQECRIHHMRSRSGAPAPHMHNRHPRFRSKTIVLDMCEDKSHPATAPDRSWYRR